MKRVVVLLTIGAIALSAASVAGARAHVSVVINPFGERGYPPPVIYHDDPYYDPYYAAPPVVYFGGGSWGGGREWHSRDHDRRDRHARDRDDRGDRGDRRH